MKHYETYFYSTFFAFLFLFSLVWHAGCYYFYLDLHPGKSGTQAPGDLANKYNVKRKRNLWKIGWSQNVADVGVSWSLLSFSGQTSKWSTNATHCYTQQNLGKESREPGYSNEQMGRKSNHPRFHPSTECVFDVLYLRNSQSMLIHKKPKTIKNK